MFPTWVLLVRWCRNSLLIFALHCITVQIGFYSVSLISLVICLWNSVVCFIYTGCHQQQEYKCCHKYDISYHSLRELCFLLITWVISYYIETIRVSTKFSILEHSSWDVRFWNSSPEKFCVHCKEVVVINRPISHRHHWKFFQLGSAAAAE